MDWTDINQCVKHKYKHYVMYHFISKCTLLHNCFAINWGQNKLLFCLFIRLIENTTLYVQSKLLTIYMCTYVWFLVYLYTTYIVTYMCIRVHQLGSRNDFKKYFFFWFVLLKFGSAIGIVYMKKKNPYIHGFLCYLRINLKNTFNLELPSILLRIMVNFRDNLKFSCNKNQRMKLVQ